MRTILIFCPAIVSKDEHLEMIRIQALLRNRLRRYNKSRDLLLLSALICDGAELKYFGRLLDLQFNFKVWEWDIERQLGCKRPRGVRRPTDYCIDILVRQLPRSISQGDLFLLRVIQDTFVHDAEAFLQEIDTLAQAGTGTFLAGKIAESVIDTHHLPKIGLKPVERIRYAHGEVLLAPADVWRRYYVRLPSFITHFTDDVLMSEWINQEGGSIIGLNDTFDHIHDCALDRLAEIKRSHISV